MAEASIDKYAGELARALHARNVDSTRIGEVVAEVRTHVADSGEDPREAFGTPREYAATVAEHANRFADPVTWVAVALGGLAGWLLTQTVFALVDGRADLYGLPVLAVGVAAAVLAALTVVAAARTYRPVVDQSTRTRVLPGGGWPTAFVLAALVLVVALVAVATRGLG